MQTITNRAWYDQMTRKLQINGKSERTQEAYLRSVRQLGEHFQKDPSGVTEEELEQYFLYRRNVTRWAPKSLRLSYYGIKFFFRFVLNCDFQLFSVLKAQKEERLPEIPAKETILNVLAHVTTFHNFVFFSTVYSCGLRLQEALNLEVSDIDSRRMMLFVHRGKGAKDRYVPLAHQTLRLLRRYWKTHRNPRLIFPALGRGHRDGPTSSVPMNRASVQGALTRAVKKAGVNNRISVHTLRHAYATHLLEQGVNVRVIQRYMGHKHLETTMRYLHLTRIGTDDARKIIDSFMHGFSYDRT
jgi:site-specific recombinase XerD